MRRQKLKKFSKAQASELLEHLRTRLNPDYAQYLVQEFDMLCRNVKPTKKGRRKPTFLDGLILSLNPCAFKRGRKKQDQRADLIRQLSDYYPSHIPKQSRDGHFEATVKKILKFSGLPGSSGDAVDMIHRALRGYKHPNPESKAIQAIWERIQRS